MRSNNDPRLFYAGSFEQLAEMGRVERLMHLPEAGKFFLIQAATQEELLQRDEELTHVLAAARAAGAIADFQSVSPFVPSLRMQAEDRRLQWARIYGPGAVAAQLFAALGSPEVAQTARAQAAAFTPPMTPEVWLASPVSAPFRGLWLGKTPHGWAELVTLSGIRDAGAFSWLERAAAGLPGVQLVDHLRALTKVMEMFQRRMEWLMVAGYAAVAGLLIIRYRRASWRALCPALFASVMTTGVFGLLGLNCNLFCVFGLVLSLDMGVDYGIYLQDRGGGDEQVALLGSSLSAISTLLSFGLLALSQTPALKTFGLTVLLAIGGSWLLAPCFVRTDPA